MEGKQLKMSSNLITVKIGVRCDPISIWTTPGENGTLWHGRGIYYLREWEKVWDVQYEFIELDPLPTYNIQDLKGI